MASQVRGQQQIRDSLSTFRSAQSALSTFVGEAGDDIHGNHGPSNMSFIPCPSMNRGRPSVSYGPSTSIASQSECAAHNCQKSLQSRPDARPDASVRQYTSESQVLSREIGHLMSFMPGDSFKLRGCPAQNVLHCLGSVLAGSGGSPATYDLSQSVYHIDVFISHNWSVKRWLKFVVLSYYFNRRGASIVSVIIALVGYAVTALDMLPGRSDISMGLEAQHGVVGQILIVPIFLFMLFFGHEMYWFTPLTMGTAFLDKTCINQTDPALKQEGIIKLGAFLGCSRRMIVCYTDVYLRKLWTVYEIACFLLMHPLEHLIIIHTHWALLCVCGTTVGYLNNLRWFILSSSPLGYFISFSLGLGLCYMCRRVLRQLKGAQECVASFSIHDATCFCEDDRPVVEENIILLLRNAGYVDISTQREDALEAFNRMVREHLPSALKISMGTSGVPYHYLFAAMLPMGCALFMDVLPGFVSKYGLLGRETTVLLLLKCIDTFAVTPACVQTLAMLMSPCMELQGWKEMAYVMCCLLVSTPVLVFVGYDIPVRLLVPRALKSDMSLAVLILYEFALVLYAVGVFGGASFLTFSRNALCTCCCCPRRRRIPKDFVDRHSIAKETTMERQRIAEIPAELPEWRNSISEFPEFTVSEDEAVVVLDASPVGQAFPEPPEIPEECEKLPEHEPGLGEFRSCSFPTKAHTLKPIAGSSSGPFYGGSSSLVALGCAGKPCCAQPEFMLEEEVQVLPSFAVIQPSHDAF